MTVQQYKTIKALTELTVVVGAFVGAGLGNVPWTLATLVAAGVVGGAEMIDAVLAAQGRDALADAGVNEEQIREIVNDELPEGDDT